MVSIVAKRGTEFKMDYCAEAAGNRATARRRLSLVALLMGSACLASQAHAQAVTPNLVSACSGVSLPPSVVTGILAPVVDGIVAPVEGSVNPILGFLGGVLGLPNLNIDTTTLLADAAAGDPITLRVLAADGTIVGPAERCDLQADSFSLNTEGGIAIGGNRITGLGTNGLDASAGEASSIAFGNSASTAATSANSIAFGTDAGVGANAAGGIAFGTGAQVTAANSVALGTNSVAGRGAQTGYMAFGLAAAQTSAGEFSVGAAGAERQITNVAAGSAPTDAVNVAQLAGVAAQVGSVADTAVLYDSAARDQVTLAGAAGTTISNLAPGAVAAGSTDAVNGSQLFATNGNVTNLGDTITNLTTNIDNGAVGTVQYSNAATPTVPNGGTPTNELTLVGAADAPVGLHNVRAGTVAAGSTDAVNGGQLFTLGTQVDTLDALAVQYDDATRAQVTLGGAGAPAVALTNVAAGTLGAGSTDAVNGSQLFATNTNVTNLTTNVTNGAVGPVQYANAGTPTVPNGGTPTNELTLVGAADAPVRLHNVGAGTVAAGSTDAVNGDQLFTLSDQIGTIDALSVQYDDATRTQVTLGGAGAPAVALTNVAAGTLGAGSTDAVNGSQLFATNTNVTNNSNAITNLTTNVNNGAIGTVQYSNAGTPTVPNGGTPTNELTLVGATDDPVGLHNVRAGTVAAGSTDAVNGDQLFTLGSQIGTIDALAVRYDDATRTQITLGGAGAPAVALTNVAAGMLGAGSTDAVNGSQLFATNTNITNLTTNVTNGAVGPVQYANAGTPTVPNGGTPTNELTLVGAADAPVRLHNVGAGTVAAGSTDAVNGDQLFTLGSQIGTIDALSVQYDDATRTQVTLGGAGAPAVALTNVAAGTLSAGSTDAVNGSQLFATNTNVTNNSNAITNLTTNVNNGAVGTVQYSNAGTPTVPNGGTPTNELTLVGATAAPVGLHNVRAGTVAAGSTDAVNGGQLFTLSTQVGTLDALAVRYDDLSRSRVTLGGAGAAPVVLGNVAAGTLAAGSTEAVNGGQLVGLGNSVAGAIGGNSSYDPTTNIVTTSLAYGGTTYNSVQAAFNAVDGAVNGGAGIRYFHVQSTRGDSVVSADDSIAIGPEAVASATNSVALGTGATAARGGQTGYMAVGLAAAQTSAGEVSVGASGAERQVTNVAAGSAPTDAVNVAQLTGVADQVAALGATTVQYDGADKTVVTLGGAGGTTVTNVKAGTLTATSTDAVNGSQLFATNVNVANNTTAITNLSNSITNGTAGPVQYSNPGTPTVPNGGTRTNDLTLVGAAPGPVGLHNVANGSVAAGSTDAVNGGQLNTTNQAVATAQTTANTALVLGQNSVQYDNSSHTEVTLGSGGSGAGAGGPVSIHNVAAGTSATDAVNVAQLNSGLNSAVTQANFYTDQRIAAISYDLRQVRRESNAGTAGALAAAGLPQAYEAGKGMIALAGGTYRGQSAFALGFSKAMVDGHTVVKLSGTYDTRGSAGAAAGIGYQF